MRRALSFRVRAIPFELEVVSPKVRLVSSFARRKFCPELLEELLNVVKNRGNQRRRRLVPVSSRRLNEAVLSEFLSCVSLYPNTLPGVPNRPERSERRLVLPLVFGLEPRRNHP